jgi:branched-chain amino acid transport system substrate-binding protein
VSQLDRRQVLKLFGAAGLAAPALAACTSQTSTAPVSSPVRVGFLVPQSGPNKSIGADMLAGFQLYLNLHGGQLGGHAVQLIPAEEGDSADTGRAAVDKLIKEKGVQVLAGVGGSAVMTGIREQVETAQLPLIGTNASPTTLGGVKYIWRTSYVDNEAAGALGRYLGNQRNQTVYVVSDESASAGGYVTGFLTQFNGIVKHPNLADDPQQIPLAGNPGTPLTTYLNGIKSSGAHAVFAAVSGPGAAAFFRAYRAAGITAPLYVPGFATEGAALKELGDSATGVYTSMNYSADLDNQANRMFVGEYQKAYNNTPSTYAMASYDAGAVLDKALSLAAGDVAPQSINVALSQVGQIDSPRGVWQFNQSRTPQQHWYLRQVRKTGPVLSNVQLGDLSMLG